MSTPIKPPGSPPPGGPEPGDGRDAALADRTEGRAGEFREAVEEAAEADADAVTGATGTGAAEGATRLGELREELAAGRVDVDGAIDRLVQQALRSAAPLPPADRAALEAQLREALSEDPTLVALRRDLERASKG